ncbi:hypothetical protein GALMADRAFT_252737 [Galerina marginata CBS 339.88]|uniref:J domain-containing protein n=1 Tax=Galerina marginata (strain CBS 339.88) TaxID=685588 RepID=A0A067SNW0_GALM3|nr:hypothetical protein GALMADRAFT_252737 [Galerina marginata CBS 339.88]
MDDSGPSRQENSLYAVLNLPKGASQAEIHERHRALSLIFHPDKQTNDSLKTAATKEFLEIQKAYQVLSDPFLRQVYDTLGSEGLGMQWPIAMRSKSKEEIQEILNQNEINITRHRLRQSLIPKGKFSCSFDASPLFDRQSTGVFGGSTKTIRDRIRATGVLSQSLVYGAETKVTESTSIALEGRSNFEQNKGSIRFLGTVRHQFSPRIVTLATFNFFHPYVTRFEVNYEDSDNAVNCKTAFSPVIINIFPSTTLSFTRRLFRSEPQRGKITLHLAKQPSISFFYVSPPTLDLTEEEGLSPQFGPPTTLGLKFVAFERNIGVTFDAIFPTLIAETSLVLIELSTRLKASIQYSVAGLSCTLGANWSNETAEVSSTLILNPTGLLLQFDLNYLEQQLSLPIVLSIESSPLLALGTIIVPSSVSLLGYYFLVIPRRRARRRAHFQASRKAFEEDSDSRRERNAVQSVLKDAVRKQLRLEAGREGLVIQEATYGAAETEVEGAKESLFLDITVPLQALVRNSQLHIPGGTSKAALQGFSDPAPFTAKLLRIRYLFRGLVHYAEIPDYMPVVLPLAEHQVKGTVDEKTGFNTNLPPRVEA